MFTSLFRPNIQKLVIKKDIKGLIAALKVDDSDFLVSAIKALGDLKAEDSIDSLVTVQEKTTDIQVMKAVYLCLCSIGTDKALIKVDDLTNPGYASFQENPDIFVALISPLIDICNEKAIELIRKLCFRHTDPVARVKMMYIIGDRKKEELLPLLIQATQDSDPVFTQQPTGNPQEDYDYRRGIPIIRSKFMRQAGIDGITKLGPQVFDKYMRWPGNLDTPYQQIAYLHVLNNIGGEKGHEIIKARAEKVDGDATVRRVAQSLLEK